MYPKLCKMSSIEVDHHSSEPMTVSDNKRQDSNDADDCDALLQVSINSMRQLYSHYDPTVPKWEQTLFSISSMKHA